MATINKQQDQITEVWEGLGEEGVSVLQDFLKMFLTKEKRQRDTFENFAF